MNWSKPVKFGNGAKLKAYKKHINEEMVIMTSKKYEEFMKKIMESSEVSDKEMEKNESALTDR